MSVAESTSRRRERRIALRRGNFVEFRHPGQAGEICRAALVDVSISGLCFEHGSKSMALEGGVRLPDFRITVGWCGLNGEFLVKNTYAVGDDAIRSGGIFYPDSEQIEQRLMVLISGLEAARPN